MTAAGTMQRRDLLLALSEELDDLGAAALSLQGALGEVMAGGLAAGGRALWQLQEIDRLQQTLEDLAAILRHAAQSDGPQVDVAALVSVARLGALRERLRGTGGPPPEGEAAGVVALF